MAVRAFPEHGPRLLEQGIDIEATFRRFLTDLTGWPPERVEALIAKHAAITLAPDPLPGVLGPLTRSERDVLRLVAMGYTNPQAAARRVCTLETVKTHVSRAITKLGAADRTHAVVIALATGELP